MSKSQGFQSTNGEQPRGPSTELEIWDKVLDPSVDDEELERANYGVGYYPSSGEYWQQVETFVRGMYANAAFGRTIDKRAVYETKRALADELWESIAQHADEDGQVAVEVPEGREKPRIAELVIVQEDDLDDEQLAEVSIRRFDRKEFLAEYADEAWERLEPADEDLDREEREFITEYRRNLAIQEVTGIPAGSFKAPHHRMLDFKHEASRSREGRLMDNAFQRVKRHEHAGEGGEQVRRRLGRR